MSIQSLHSFIHSSIINIQIQEQGVWFVGKCQFSPVWSCWYHWQNTKEVTYFNHPSTKNTNIGMPSLMWIGWGKSLYCHNTHYCITFIDLLWYIYICVNESNWSFLNLHYLSFVCLCEIHFRLYFIWNNYFCAEFMYFVQNLIVLIRTVKLRWTPVSNYLSSRSQATVTWEKPERHMKTVVPHLHYHRFFSVNCFTECLNYRMKWNHILWTCYWTVDVYQHEICFHFIVKLVISNCFRIVWFYNSSQTCCLTASLPKNINNSKTEKWKGTPWYSSKRVISIQA
jgi:hypothetical protein